MMSAETRKIKLLTFWVLSTLVLTTPLPLFVLNATFCARDSEKSSLEVPTEFQVQSYSGDVVDSFLTPPTSFSNPLRNYCPPNWLPNFLGRDDIAYPLIPKVPC